MENTKLKDRRKSFRYPTQLSIDLVLADGETLSLETINISQNGLQFHCESWIANKIEPRGIHNHPLDHIPLTIVAIFPIPDQDKLHASGRIVVAERLSQREYLIGLEFIDFTAGGKETLEQFIHSLEEST